MENAGWHQNHHRHPRRRTRRGRIRTPRLPRHAGHGAGVLPRPGPMGARRPDPVGCVGGTVPDQPAGPGPPQVPSPPQGPHGQPHPRTAARATRAGPRAADRWRRESQQLLQAGQQTRPRQGVHRCRKDPDQDRPAHCGPGQRLGKFPPRHRQTTTTQPRRGTRILGMGAHRSVAPHLHPGEGTARTQPPQPDSVPTAQHRRTGAATADRPFQDRHRTTSRGRPGAGRRAQRRHLPRPRRPERNHPADPCPRQPRTGLATAVPATLPTAIQIGNTFASAQISSADCSTKPSPTQG